MEQQNNSKSEPIFDASEGLVYKKETVFKHKNRIQELKQNKSREMLLLKKFEKDQQSLPKMDIKTPESFVHEYLTRQRNYAKYKHLVWNILSRFLIFEKRRPNPKTKTFTCESENGPVLIIRIKGDSQIPEQPRRILKSLRLYKIHSADVHVLDDKLRKALKVVAPYVIYGNVSRSVLKKLFRQRGFAIDEKIYKPISNEEIIEEKLGHLEIICIDDIGKAILYN